MKLRHAMVCASNQNRSMEAHALLQRQGLDVSSYGTGSHVKLPGPSAREPNVYSFGTPYRTMLEDLIKKDPELYKRNGLLQMLKRNLGVKEAPQRWQDNAADGAFDVVFTFEERVFDMVIDDACVWEQLLLHLFQRYTLIVT
uniref:RNA polymerase II subunit A C-terminal domain phosphatase SSU72 n=1 Tax=Physcomitrium patens TaxID=3218 RepID=A0A7I4CXG0_PHYPA